jgi:TPR repeat protein
MRIRLPKLAVIALVALATGCVDKTADRAYQRGDYQTTARDLQSLAEGGEARAQYDLALLYDKGLGVPQDDGKALYWYRRAAEQGEKRAQYNLALMYMNGQGVVPDYIRAYYWLSMAQVQGDLNAPAAREYLADKMAPHQVKEAQLLVDARIQRGELPVFHNEPPQGP